MCGKGKGVKKKGVREQDFKTKRGGGILLCNDTSYPFSWWSRLVWISESVHDAVGLETGFVLIGNVGLFVKDKKQVHQITCYPAAIYAHKVVSHTTG